MTEPAVGGSVASPEWEARVFVAEGIIGAGLLLFLFLFLAFYLVGLYKSGFVDGPMIGRNIPAIRRVAGSAVHFEIIAMRGLSGKTQSQPHKSDYK